MRRGRRCPCAGPQPFAEADACGPAAGFPFFCLEFVKKIAGPDVEQMAVPSPVRFFYPVVLRALIPL